MTIQHTPASGATDLDEINICHTWLEQHAPLYVSLPGGSLRTDEVEQAVELVCRALEADLAATVATCGQ